MKRFYILFTIVLMGCTPSLESDAVLIIDQTEKGLPLDQNMLFSAFRNITHGRVTLTAIVDQSFSRNTTLKKAKGESYLLRVESKERERAFDFEQDFKNGLRAYNTSTKELSKSYVYSVLVASFYRLMQSKSDRKSILVFSDMCENTSEFSFYRYRKNPLQIRDDFQKITSLLEHQDHRIKQADLSGISISVVFHPDKKDDLLFREVRHFWMQYFSAKNAQVEFISSLENSSQIQGI